MSEESYRKRCSMGSRYDASGRESEWQPGSGAQVLRNAQDIVDPAEMDELESVLLEKLYERILGDDFPDRQLAVADIKSWHRQWLGNLYEWAGEERSVNLAKGGFHFAAAAQLPRLLDEFQKTCLACFTPAHHMSDDEFVTALSVTHVELVLIHPFREGNGRIARLVSDVMAVQAGHNILDYSR
ncbi:Fic family protein [Gammaproteobacteria bacterium AB-CW1]|uniref:protein adenylyltransferase n=1 Tax=Natronospira elongata TaxID=3110268 RepID=A0AAP6JGQ0_9GAMM|nr:Fic family protein [Gammaproteobacteria bacterium AB-CW1]